MTWQKQMVSHEARQAYTDWLAGQRWTYFCTLTFREWEDDAGTLNGVYTPDGARRVAQRFYKPFGRAGHRLVCLFIESGSLYGKVHLHGLLRYDEPYRPAALTIWERWFDRYGAARVESVRSREAISAYCTKYCTKHLKDETYIIML